MVRLGDKPYVIVDYNILSETRVTPLIASALCGTNQLPGWQPVRFAPSGGFRRSRISAQNVSCVTRRLPLGGTHPPELRFVTCYIVSQYRTPSATAPHRVDKENACSRPV